MEMNRIAIPDIPHPTNPERNSRDDLQKAIAQYVGTMFNDSTKIAMFTAEQGHGVPNTAFKKDQADLVADIHAIFAEYGLSEKFRVDATRIATDIESKLLGKDLGMRRILAYAQEELKIKPGHIDTFGDSKSDIEMAKEAIKQGFDTSFICVGGKELADTLSDDDTPGECVSLLLRDLIKEPSLIFNQDNPPTFFLMRSLTSLCS